MGVNQDVIQFDAVCPTSRSDGLAVSWSIDGWCGKVDCLVFRLNWPVGSPQPTDGDGVL